MSDVRGKQPLKFEPLGSTCNTACNATFRSRLMQIEILTHFFGSVIKNFRDLKVTLHVLPKLSIRNHKGELLSFFIVYQPRLRTTLNVSHVKMNLY
jgi:hypothetical protein